MRKSVSKQKMQRCEIGKAHEYLAIFPDTAFVEQRNQPRAAVAAAQGDEDAINALRIIKNN